MNVAFNEKDLVKYLTSASELSPEHPVVISKFITNAREVEIDAVANKGELIIWAVTEHVENAGVHSGDATMVFPPQKTYIETIKRIKRTARRIANSLEITGPFNIQFIAKENEIKVIECNLRASRSFPFVSKVSKTNFIELATKVILGKKVGMHERSALELDYVGVKAPQFSFSRLKGADPILRVEMASTGEVACLGDDLREAFLKSVISTGFRIPEKSVLVSISGDINRYKMLEDIKKLYNLHFKIYATYNTSRFLKEHSIENILIHKVHEKRKPNVVDHLTNRKIDLVINIPDPTKEYVLDDSYAIRRLAVDFSVPLITNSQLTTLFVDAISTKDMKDLEIKSWDEYK